jgi:hypothetical protein
MLVLVYCMYVCGSTKKMLPSYCGDQKTKKHGSHVHACMQSAENLLVCKRFYCIYIYILYVVNRPLTLNSYDHADIELTRQFRPETEIKSICIQPATASQTEPTEAAGYLGKEQALYIPTSSASYSI